MARVSSADDPEGAGRILPGVLPPALRMITWLIPILARQTRQQFALKRHLLCAASVYRKQLAARCTLRRLASFHCRPPKIRSLSGQLSVL
jgi:hypothetical protein